MHLAGDAGALGVDGAVGGGLVLLRGAAQLRPGVQQPPAQFPDAEPGGGRGGEGEDRGAPGGQERQQAAERGGHDGGDGQDRRDGEVPVPAVQDRAVGGEDGGPGRDRRYRGMGGERDRRDRGGDHEPGHDRVQPPGRQRQRGQRGGGERCGGRVDRDRLDRDGAAGADEQVLESAVGHLHDRADRRGHRDRGVERQRPAGRRAARLGLPEEGDQPVRASGHEAIVAGRGRGAIARRV